MSISSSLDGWGIQDIGHDHVHALGFDKTHPVGVVRRTVVDLIRPIEFQDMLRLRRWCSGTSTRWCEIHVRIDGGAGGLIESEAFWININRDTGMPPPGDDFPTAAAYTDVHRLQWTATARTLSRCEYPVRFTDTDLLDHMNNAVYRASRITCPPVRTARSPPGDPRHEAPIAPGDKSRYPLASSTTGWRGIVAIWERPGADGAEGRRPTVGNFSSRCGRNDPFRREAVGHSVATGVC